MISQTNLTSVIFANLSLAVSAYWTHLFFPAFKFLSNLGFYSICFVGICLFILLGSRWLFFGYFPLSNLYESLKFLAWGIILLIAIAARQSNVFLIGTIGTPIVLSIILFANLCLPDVMHSPSALVPALKSNWLIMHVSVMMASYISLLVGSLLSIFFLVYVHNKKQKNLIIYETQLYKEHSIPMFCLLENSVFYTTKTESLHPNLTFKSNTREDARIQVQLTLLERLDNLSYELISLGFPLLTIGITTGAIWANEAWGSYWSWDPKETWALSTWLTFASYLHVRINRFWRGEKPALVASIGFVLVWICYLGVNFLHKGLHLYGTIS